MEKKAGVLCIGVLIAIVILGKMFGGRIIGLLPLGACISSGIWLWMKEVVRSGREVEWESEKTRGQTVSFVFFDWRGFKAESLYRLPQTYFPSLSNG